MHSRWFKEERQLPSSDQTKAIAESKEVLGHSVLMTQKLKRILEEEIEATYYDDEKVGTQAWEKRVLANAGARKVLRKLIGILPKGA